MYSSLKKMIPTIDRMLNKLTDGEVTGFEFFEHLMGTPNITVWLLIPVEVKKKYDYNFKFIIEKHKDKIMDVISALGYTDFFSKNKVAIKIL